MSWKLLLMTNFLLTFWTSYQFRLLWRPQVIDFQKQQITIKACATTNNVNNVNLSFSTDSEEIGRDQLPHSPAQNPEGAGAQRPCVPKKIQQWNPLDLQAAKPGGNSAPGARKLLGPEEEAAVPDAQAGKVLGIQGTLQILFLFFHHH